MTLLTSSPPTILQKSRSEKKDGEILQAVGQEFPAGSGGPHQISMVLPVEDHKLQQVCPEGSCRLCGRTQARVGENVRKRICRKEFLQTDHNLNSPLLMVGGCRGVGCDEVKLSLGRKGRRGGRRF